MKSDISYLLDTDIVSYMIKRNNPTLSLKIASIYSSRIAISSITKAELLYGLERVGPTHRFHDLVNFFLDTILVLDWPAQAAGPYATIKHQLTQSGLGIGEPDMLIAAHAITLGAVLVTNNVRHYSRIRHPGFRYENWINPTS